MIGLLVVFVLLTGLGMGAWFFADEVWPDLRDELRRDQVVRKVRRADTQVGEAARDAKRAMNTAAGQSWRNRFE